MTNQGTTESIQAVPAETLCLWVDEGSVVVVDVREPDEFGTERIAGARLVPLEQVYASSVPTESGRRTVLCCRSGNRSGMAAEKLIRDGATEVLHLEGGLKAWTAAGLPTVGRPSSSGLSIMRQVQITVGLLVMVAIAIGAFVSPWFLLLAGFCGAGLFFAGISGTCGLAVVLKMMPWNRCASVEQQASTRAACCS
ncbi:MAG: rhodanese-like domain-containing protein [Phycisphaerae bacterium]|nr:rhodanese-like domain-containing protein [Phycisphaerae bacterium]